MCPKSSYKFSIMQKYSKNDGEGQNLIQSMVKKLQPKYWQNEAIFKNV